MNWERKTADRIESDAGYFVTRYTWREPGKRRHFEAWPPKRRRMDWPDCYRMLGIRSTAKGAMALCEAHFEQQQSEVK